jgi:hypothetical protein
MLNRAAFNHCVTKVTLAEWGVRELSGRKP